jgi:glycosyltransferase involved in cell wall biosynthesis
MRIGYVVSRYPAVSHTFILREVLGLRRLGWEIVTVSIRAAKKSDLLTDVDRSEASNTHIIVRKGPGTAISALGVMLATFFSSPGRFFAAAGTARRLRRPGLKGAAWAFFYFLEALLLHRLCRREGLHHLHAHFANVASDVAMIAAVLNRGTFSFTMHGPTEFFDIPGHRLPEKARAAAAIFCISDFARSQMMALLPSAQWHKLHIVHCGVDPMQFAERAPGSPLTRQPGSPIKILCVARLTEVKAHAVLLRAVAEMLQAGHDPRLTLAGDGPLRKDLEALAAELRITDRVRFLGSVGQDAIAALYATADVFALPSFAEGVPVVLMEAMASGCPVVATRIAGIPELIEHGVTGMLVTPGRADLLADAILSILSSPASTARMVEGAREKIRREFNIHMVAPEIAVHFRAILEPAATRSTVASTAPFPGKAMPAVAEGRPL